MAGEMRQFGRDGGQRWRATGWPRGRAGNGSDHLRGVHRVLRDQETRRILGSIDFIRSHLRTRLTPPALVGKRITGAMKKRRFSPMAMPPHHRASHAWLLYGLPGQVWQRAVTLGRAPIQIRRIPIHMVAFRIRNPDWRFTVHLASKRRRHAHVDAVIARLAAGAVKP